MNKGKFKLDKYNQFVKKYLRSAYISKNTEKMLYEIGVDPNKINEIFDRIDYSCDFLEKCNFKTLREILQYVIDDFVDYFESIVIFTELNCKFPKFEIELFTHTNRSDV
jgi:hypothetical protein